MDLHLELILKYFLPEGYLVIVDPSVLSPEEEWPGQNLPVKVTADTMILVNQIRVSGVLLVAPNSSLLEKRTKEFSRAMKDVSITQGSVPLPRFLDLTDQPPILD